MLATSESARGLIVNMSDVLFDTGKYTLKPGTQVSLAKVATILQLYPGLKVQVEGYTDSVGGDEYNQKLSENRANAVHDFLVQQRRSRSQRHGRRLRQSQPRRRQQHRRRPRAEPPRQPGRLRRRHRRADQPAACRQPQ